MDDDQKKEVEDVSLHSWKITAHEERERTGRFYTVFFVILALLIVFAVWQKSFLFGIFILLAAGTILFLSGQRADVLSFRLTDTHLVLGNRESEYPYTSMHYYDLHSFSDTDRELFIVFKEKFRPLLRIRYYKGDEEKIQDILALKNIPRRTIEPSFLDIFSKIIGI